MTAKHIEDVTSACTAALNDSASAVPAPDILYHLTDVHGFTAIIEDRCVRASLATCLNDASEIHYGLGLAADVLGARLVAAPSAFDRAVLEYLTNPGSAPPQNQFDLFPVVVSFCRTCDKSQHWLHYGRSGRGVAIGFSRELARIAEMNLWPIDYEPSSQRDRLGRLFDCARSALGTNASESELRDAAHITSLYVPWVAARMKHPSFVDEDEWRLVAAVMMRDGKIIDDSIVKYRQSGEQLVPFVDADFSLEPSTVREVVLGYSCPTPIDAAQLLLASNDVAARITRSDVPVR